MTFCHFYALVEATDPVVPLEGVISERLIMSSVVKGTFLKQIFYKLFVGRSHTGSFGLVAFGKKEFQECAWILPDH